MVSMLESKSTSQSGLGLSPGWGHCSILSQVYKQVPTNFNTGGYPVMDYHPIQGGGDEIFLVTSCFRNQDKLQPDWLFGLYADFIFSLNLDLHSA